MKLIAVVDEKWGIGKDNHLLFSLPLDMEFFKSKTIGKTVVMGRKTFKSFPNGKPLANRKNVVLTRNVDFNSDGVSVCNSVDEIMEKYNGEDVLVIGGGEIYKQLLPYCDTAYITKVFSDGSADTFIPNLDENADWKLTAKSKKYNENGIDFVFCTYANTMFKSHFEQKTL